MSTAVALDMHTTVESIVVDAVPVEILAEAAT
jgi:hypothetical protein